jgi:hypothetical protein
MSTPAQAGTTPGWYSANPAPGNSTYCSPWWQVAVGGDRRPMNFEVCIIDRGNHTAQTMVGFQNTSTSKVNVEIYAAGIEKDGVVVNLVYRCQTKQAAGNSYLYYLGNTAHFGSTWRGHTAGNIYLNTTIHDSGLSPDIYFF